MPGASYTTQDKFDELYQFGAEPGSVGPSHSFDGDDPWWTIAATQSRPGDLPAPTPEPAEPAIEPQPTEFVPLEPESLQAAGLSNREVEALVLKFLLNSGAVAGRAIAGQLKLPFGIVVGELTRLKNEQLIVYSGSAQLNDYFYQLTDYGAERARRYSLQCSYFGAAPVPLADYIASVRAQSVRNYKPRLADLRRALGDLLLSQETLYQFGEALSSGRGMFLYGAPGNGKTSIAERVVKAFGESIWIPRAISATGHVIRLFDPSCHVPLATSDSEATLERLKLDGRWIRVRRPTIVAGGELTLANFDITTNATTGISEAPLQLKSNCGTLVIDDFGRQRVRPEDLLNRWILPLERRFDLLGLPHGRKIKVPCDQVIVVSTNLEPRHLVDEAFLRRVPYKIELVDPTEEEFRELFRRNAETLGIRFNGETLDHLIGTQYQPTARPMRFCQPRDLLEQVANYCTFRDLPLEMSREAMDAAVKNYFAVT